MTFLALRRLHEDPRYHELSPVAARALDHALVTWADGENRWQVKWKTWADAIGVSRRTLARAIAEAEKVGLLVRTPYLRPGRSGQGASIFGLVLAKHENPVFMGNRSAAGLSPTRGVTDDTPCENNEAAERQGVSPVARLARGVTDDTPKKERVSNEKPSAGRNAQANGGRPHIGDEGYPALLATAFSNGHITEGELEQAHLAHRFVELAESRTS